MCFEQGSEQGAFENRRSLHCAQALCRVAERVRRRDRPLESSSQHAMQIVGNASGAVIACT
jgi:hypothetical protein